MTWQVTRFGGRSTDKRRLVFSGSEDFARAIYRKTCDAMRQGDAQLLNDAGAVIERMVAPRLRSKW